MQLIYISNTRLPTEKARGLQIMKSCEAFSKIGWSVTLIVPSGSNPIPGDPFEFYATEKVFSLKKATNLDFILNILPDQLAFYARSFVFAISSLLFFSGSNRGLFYSRDYMVLFFLALFGRDFVAEIHDYRSLKPKWPIRFFLSRTKTIICNSSGTRAALTAHYPHIAQRCLEVPNGVDLKTIQSNQEQKVVRKSLSIPEDAVLLGYTGSLEAVGQDKGVQYLIEAFDLISKANPNCLLYIIGGPDKAVERYRKMSKVPLRVIFTGRVDYRYIPAYLKAIDVAVIPLPADINLSKTSSPMKVFEFLGAGKVIVSANVPAVADYLNPSNSIFFKADDVRDLADKIQHVLDHPEIGKKLASQAAQDAEQYSWVTRAHKIKSFIVSHIKQ